MHTDNKGFVKITLMMIRKAGLEDIKYLGKRNTILVIISIMKIITVAMETV